MKRMSDQIIGVVTTKPLVVTINYPEGISQSITVPSRDYDVIEVVTLSDGSRLFVTTDMATSIHQTVIAESVMQDYREFPLELPF
jgi:hypothetical protein